MATVTRTINPLPLQDLEPHRFEDLVRQLAYDFRDWHKLEATGRAGSDDGFDARGLELLPQTSTTAAGEGDESDEAVPPATRLWLIQCKREAAIGPAKLEGYVETFGTEPLYGVILAAACNFSKKARDAFEAVCRAKGYSEVHLWGRAEIEDALFQPKNDHLLFAYFGISLKVRRRSLQSSLRAVAATKKALRRIIESKSGCAIVFRSVECSYPELPALLKPDWFVSWASDCEFGHDGLRVSFRTYRAYVSDDGEKWDAANELGLQRSNFYMGKWGEPEPHPLEKQADAEWHALPSQNQGWMHLSGRLPYENVLAIDEVGDQFHRGPIVYLDLHDGWLFNGTVAYVRPNATYLSVVSCADENRTAQFSRELRRERTAEPKVSKA